MTDVLSVSERDACTRDAMAVIMAALDRQSPEMRRAFWAAVDRLYRLQVPPDGQPRG